MISICKKTFMLSLVLSLMIGAFSVASLGTGIAKAESGGIYVNNTDPSIVYTGRWALSAGRGGGDYKDDLHYTSANGDSAELAFVGSGIEVVSPASNDSGYGKFEVFIDGESQGIVDTAIGSGDYVPQQIVYSDKTLSDGAHTIRIVKESGSYTQLDAFIVYMTDRDLADLAKARIDALPDSDKVTLADKAAVEAAANLYASLTDEQKALVGDISRLEAAQSALQALSIVQMTDKITYLMADRADRSASLGIAVDPGHEKDKRFWVTNWTSEDDYFKWTVDAPAEGEYVVDVLVNAPATSEITVTSASSDSVQVAGTGDWDKIRADGTLTLPEGVSVITVKATNPNNQLKSLELIPADEWPAMEQRIADFRSDTTWFRDAAYGVFFQWGEWGYPQSGDKKQWPKQIDDFDVNAFADRMSRMGAGYVVWSVTWWSYYFPAPIQAIDDILPGHTSRRDLIGELADALNKKGIRLMLYYHTGSETQDWWDANWVSMDDKSKFLTNWRNIMTEVGNRYGTKLAGWYIDDDCIYYPADYEELGAAAKAGNPDRIITYNNSIGPRGTDFQDYSSFEWWTPQSDNDNGIIRDGRYKGLQAHTAFITENDWGVHQPDQPIVPSLSADAAVSRILQAIRDHQVLSYNMMMYEDGTMNPSSVQMMIKVKNAARYGIIGTDEQRGPSDSLDMYNDSDPRIAYTGGWAVSSGRGGDTYRKDVHFTMNDGDSAAFTFKGTGVQFITETDSNQGDIEVFVDGASEGTIDARSDSRQTNQVLYTADGLAPDVPHTIKLVKKNGDYMLVDAFRVVSAGTSNEKPVANDYAVKGASGADIVGQLSPAEPSDGMLTFSLEQSARKGTAVIDYASGKFSYTPNEGASGTDTFTYVVDDGTNISAPATVTVQLIEPVAVTASEPADQAVNVPYSLAAAKITYNQTVRQGEDFDLIALHKGAETVQANVYLQDQNLFVAPVGGFQPATSYELIVPAAAIAGELGDHPAGDYRLSFKTASRPTVPSNPGSNAGDPSASGPSQEPDPGSANPANPTDGSGPKTPPKLTPTPGFVAEFTDIQKHWAAPDIELLASLSLLNGKTRTAFAPNEPITRAEFASLLVRILGDATPGGSAPAFSDVSGEAWYAEAIGAAASAGIVNGYADGTFKPNGPITREQMAVMIIRFMKAAGQAADTLPASDLALEPFKDRQAISAWAQEAAAVCVEAGIMQGGADHRLVPAASATRAEAAAMTVRLLRHMNLIDLQ